MTTQETIDQAEQACFDALVTHNKPLTTDDPPYPACLWDIAVAATAAVKEALDQEEA